MRKKRSLLLLVLFSLLFVACARQEPPDVDTAEEDVIQQPEDEAASGEADDTAGEEMEAATDDSASGEGEAGDTGDEEMVAATDDSASDDAGAVDDCPPYTLATGNLDAGKWPQQYELDEYEAAAGCDLALSSRDNFDERLFEYMNLPADLPPVEERLPEEPMVVVPYEAIGSYGGRLNAVSLGPESGNSEWLSIRHVNLVRYLDDINLLVPNVARDYEWNDDFTTITFWLRRGHKWSDGQPFTVDDILFWYEDIILNEELVPEVPSYWVYGGEPMQIEKIDDVTFNVHFAAPAPGFLNWLGRSWIQPWAPKQFLSRFHLDYNPDIEDEATEEGFADWKEYFYSWYGGDWQDAVHRYGLPKLESHILVDETTEHKIFAANPYYFKVDTQGNQLPYIDELEQTYAPDQELIELKIINGEVDIKSQTVSISSLPLYQENLDNGNYDIQLAPSASAIGTYTFNCTSDDPLKREIFSNPRFSEAMSLALDRDEMNEVLCFGLCSPQQAVPVHRSVSFAQEEWFTHLIDYDPDRANEILDEIGLDEKDSDGFRLLSNGEPLVIYLAYPLQAGNPARHELTKEYWEDVGVRVELREISSEAYRTMASNNEHDIAMFNSGATVEPILLSSPLRLTPPFGDAALEPLCGGPWLEWYNSDGASGEEPPEDVQQLWPLVDQWKSSMPGSDEYAQLGQQIVEIHRDHMWLIGAVSNPPSVTIVSRSLGNTPEWTINGFEYYRTYPFRPDQWYFTES